MALVRFLLGLVVAVVGVVVVVVVAVAVVVWRGGLQLGGRRLRRMRGISWRI
jgi:hypothetical protein